MSPDDEMEAEVTPLAISTIAPYRDYMPPALAILNLADLGFWNYDFPLAILSSSCQ